MEVSGPGLIEAPFTFTGGFAAYADPAHLDPLGSWTSTGSGVLRWTLAEDELRGGLITDDLTWVFEFQAAPILEPATLLLLGGIAALVSRRRAAAGRQLLSVPRRSSFIFHVSSFLFLLSSFFFPPDILPPCPNSSGSSHSTACSRTPRVPNGG